MIEDGSPLDLTKIKKIVFYVDYYCFAKNEPWNWSRREIEVTAIELDLEVIFSNNPQFYDVIVIAEELDADIKVIRKTRFPQDQYFTERCFNSAVCRGSKDYQYPKFSELDYWRS